jgi:3-phosphoshikimate 1-carboxyvinyltransferase
MGVTVTERPDGMEIEGGAQLKGATIDSFGDHRIAMAFAIAGLHAEGTTIINDTECIATSYPGFERELQHFLNHEKGHTAPIPVVSRMPIGLGVDTLSKEDKAD